MLKVKKSVHPEGFEPSTFWSVARRSIQLSYGCITIKSAGVQGFEPRPPGPEPGVLPLDDTPNNKKCD
ncbi:uncharacterized protein METZ01_LOCUS52000 [marine metagenome]|uniref:Uncharacterized protein n=1 Tax=marine metagenome TaxID=408172 RepID=A0A381S4Z4_9ZZZZ